MIDKITIESTASYTGRTEIHLRKLNFFYGANGSGKTTISKILRSPDSFPKCEIGWISPDHEEVLVYNRPFVAKNFEESESLLGIFTLGEDSIAVQHEIEETRKLIEQAITERVGLNTSIGQQRQKLEAAMKIAVDACWAVQVEYGSQFASALSGGRNSKERFFQMCVDAYGERASIPIIDFDKLQERYSAAYTKNATVIPEYTVPDRRNLESTKDIALLQEVITGKSDTPIGRFIQYLGASDWVRKGVILASQTKGRCPYCQREMPESLEQEIEHFFDEAYKKDIESLSQYASCYESVVNAFETQMQSIIERKCDIIDYDIFEKKLESFIETAKRNIEMIKKKISTPTETVQLESLYEIGISMIDLIEDYNQKIKDHNLIIGDQTSERDRVRKQVWRFIITRVEANIASYIKQKNGIEAGIRSLEAKVKEKTEYIRSLHSKVQEEEAKLTSVNPTVSAINNILAGFGFDGFRLEENAQKKGTYVITRPDGTDASTTLSEGEHNFLTFLYFYHLCFGSQNTTGLLQNRILVIDDPISSMDSSVLFIVSTLVKTMIEHCRKNEKGIKQIVILTHNVYFHKEITFLGNRNDYAKDEVFFFILRKRNENTSVEIFEKNPIMSSYEMLWEDIRNPSSSTAKSVFNTMRRILEYYFTVIGGMDYEKCISQFTGEDKIACKALVAYINDGSHSVYDDLIVPIEDSALHNYQRIFRLIFEKLNHIDHYNMMMKITG